MGLESKVVEDVHKDSEPVIDREKVIAKYIITFKSSK